MFPQHPLVGEKAERSSVLLTDRGRNLGEEWSLTSNAIHDGKKRLMRRDLIRPLLGPRLSLTSAVLRSVCLDSERPPESLLLPADQHRLVPPPPP